MKEDLITGLQYLLLYHNFQNNCDFDLFSSKGTFFHQNVIRRLRRIILCVVEFCFDGEK
jgi:hypothetical protein